MGNLLSKSEVNIVPQPPIDPTIAFQIMEKQNKLLDELEKTINDTNNMVMIDGSGPTVPKYTNPPYIGKYVQSNNQNVETFVNPSTQDQYYPPVRLPLSNEPEIKDYVNSYNRAVSLLDDPNQATKANFDAYIHLQDEKIKELQKAINSFPQNSNINNNPIKSIKNLQTSVALNLETYSDPNSSSVPKNYTGNGAPNYPNYLIYGNNGCLKYTPGDKPSNAPGNTNAGVWGFQSCNSNDPSQRFYMNKINNMDDYNATITNPAMQSYKINDANSAIFGFYVVNPELDNSQCVQINQNGLSVIPCNMDSSQRFKPYYHNINP